MRCGNRKSFSCCFVFYVLLTRRVDSEHSVTGKAVFNVSPSILPKTAMVDGLPDVASGLDDPYIFISKGLTLLLFHA